MADIYDYLFKFLLIGNSGVGKSCVLSQFIDEQFRVDSSHTIGVEFASKIISFANRKVKLQIWDTAGQERFRSVTKSYYRKAAGALLVYDVTDRESFNNLGNWLIDIKQLSGEEIIIILVGNKIDKPEESREVSFIEGTQFAQENELMFIETSALTGENVSDAFVNVARRILHNVETVFSGTGFDNSTDDFKDFRSADTRRPYLRKPNDESCRC